MCTRHAVYRGVQDSTRVRQSNACTSMLFHTHSSFTHRVSFLPTLPSLTEFVSLPFFVHSQSLFPSHSSFTHRVCFLPTLSSLTEFVSLNQMYKQYLRTHLWWSLICTLYLHVCQVRVTVGDSGLCCCTCVTSF